MAEKIKLSGGDMLMRSLHEEGVDIIFGYPGGAALHIYDALFNQDKIDHILVRHEQGATHAADGYARATGKPGVVLVTSGPGATNAITGIGTAFMDSIPMVVISGQVASHLIGTDAFQETDMIGISRPIVKHSYTVFNAADIPKIIKEAFYVATSGRPGPVVIDIPKDMTAPDILFDYEYPKTINLRSYNPPVIPESNQIKRAVDAIISSEKPVIYAGGGAIASNAEDELFALNEIMDAPVTNTLMGLGIYPATHERFLGMLGMHGTYQANMAMHNADLIIAIGARFDDRITNAPSKFSPQAKIIHLDVDHSSVSKIISADIAVFGQVKNSLDLTIKELKNKIKEYDKNKLGPWHNQIANWKADHGLDYELWTGVVGESRLDSDTGIFNSALENVANQPLVGNLYTSHNAGNWEKLNNNILMFNLNRCKFDISTSSKISMNVDVPSEPKDFSLFKFNVSMLNNFYEKY